MDIDKQGQLAERAVWFHHNPQVRKEERVKKLKLRKRQWLLKMYQQGMTGTGMAVSGTQQGALLSVERTAADVSLSDDDLLMESLDKMLNASDADVDSMEALGLDTQLLQVT